MFVLQIAVNSNVGEPHFQERVTVVTNWIVICFQSIVAKAESFEFFPVCFAEVLTAFLSDSVVI